MALEPDTLDPSSVPGGHGAGPPVPGLAVVFTGGRAALSVLAGGAFTLGRRTGAPGVAESPGSPALLDDGRMSRRHAEVTFRDGRWLARDLGSRNGTRGDGAALGGDGAPFRVLRVGDSVLLGLADVRALMGASVAVEGDLVIGPRLAAVWREIRAIAAAGDTLHLCGDTGSGKELAARCFHHAAGARAPFVAVNCSAVPAALAERLFFGAVRGAFSGADADADGYLVAAHGGTLFLDEVVELPRDVQAKLLRVLESREVTPLGATRARKVNLRVCSATHADLRAAVGDGRFREDLYFRLGRPAVTLPPLRERLEDVPWLLERVLARAAPELRPSTALVEALLLRPWPGNLRELGAELGEACRRAAAARAGKLEPAHLADAAGAPLAAERAPTPAEARRGEVERALRDARGNVAETARALGMHRTQLRRWLAAHGIDPAQFKP